MAYTKPIGQPQLCNKAQPSQPLSHRAHFIIILSIGSFLQDATEQTTNEVIDLEKCVLVLQYHDLPLPTVATDTTALAAPQC
jgi:hypothetical protein